MQNKSVLIACEESQLVCKAFRDRGFTAFSADIQEPSGGHPEWHILGNVLPILNGNYVPAGTSRKDTSKYGAAKRGKDSENRSKTFTGIAKAMAEQWGAIL